MAVLNMGRGMSQSPELMFSHRVMLSRLLSWYYSPFWQPCVKNKKSERLQKSNLRAEDNLLQQGS